MTTDFTILFGEDGDIEHSFSDEELEEIGKHLIPIIRNNILQYYEIDENILSKYVNKKSPIEQYEEGIITLKELNKQLKEEEQL